MTSDTTPTTEREARAAGWVRVGDWADHRGEGGVWCRPADRQAVAAAYRGVDLPDGHTPLPEHLDGVTAAGGAFMPCRD